MKVLLTGGTGRIGQQVIRYLAERGDEVCVLVRPESAAGAREIESLKQLGSVAVRRVDLFDFESLKRAARGVDVVCHLAWATGPERERSDVAAAMIRLTENLLKVSGASGVRRFVFMSSVSVYGPEGRELRSVNEDAPLLGKGFYAGSKIAGEKLIWRYSADYDLPFTILRASLVYGPGFPYVERFVNQVLTRPFLSVYRNDEHRMQLVHLRDVAQAVVLASTKLRSNFSGTLNIAGDEAVYPAELAKTVNSFVRGLWDLRGNSMPTHPRMQNHQLKYNISRARQILGFIPRVNLNQGFSELLSDRS